MGGNSNGPTLLRLGSLLLLPPPLLLVVVLFERFLVDARLFWNHALTVFTSLVNYKDKV